MFIDVLENQNMIKFCKLYKINIVFNDESEREFYYLAMNLIQLHDLTISKEHGLIKVMARI